MSLPTRVHVVARLATALLGVPVSEVGAQQVDVRRFRVAHEHQILGEFMRLLANPNLASDSAGIRRNADAIVAMMEVRGLSPRLLYGSDSSAPPAVYGEWRAPGANRTIMMYAHYDGQPTDSAKWTGSRPWVPILRTAALERGGREVALPAPGERLDSEMRVYARSASDDKGGVMAILAAVQALRATGARPSAHIKFFFEGEEEAGSPHLADLLRRNQLLVAADAWIICDGPVHQSGRKQVVYGVRGDVNVDVTVYGANRPLHSGHYGNWAPNPALRLARLLSSMKDEAGRVLISGWYDDVVPLGALERRAIGDSPAFDDTLRTQLGIGRAEGGGQPLADLINLPSLNINGMASAEVGAGARNVIPTTATATLDLRLVKGNDVARQVSRLVRHIERQGYHVIDREPTDAERSRHPMIAQVRRRGGGYNAERTAMNLPVSRAVLSAIESAFPRRTLAVPTLGGSLPLSIIGETLSVPTITVPIANYDNNQHAENESIRLQNLWDGIEMMAAVMMMSLR